jgi:CRP/FNR family transcriptional regulator
MRDLRQHHPHLERKLLQRACQELDAAQDNALALARLQPPERLADFLLRLAAREATLAGHSSNRVSLPMGRGDIADHLGLTMETVSRTFTKLRQQGLIALPHLNVVEILDFAELQKLANDGA